MEVRNGQASSFWYDVWSDMGRLLDLTGVRGCVDMEISLRASVATACHDGRHRSDLYTMIEEALHKQRNKMTMGADVTVWKSNTDIFKPKFSTSNTWSLLRSHELTVSWLSSIWFSYATLNYAFIAWLAMHNRLKTRDRILLWNVGV